MSKRVRKMLRITAFVVVSATPAMSCSSGNTTAESSSTSSSTTTRSASSSESASSTPKVATIPADLFSGGIDEITRSAPQKVDLADGSSAWVSDVGSKSGTPVLFISGSATSATAVDLVSFLSSAQQTLDLRLIAVERNGFGDTPLDPNAGYEDFAEKAIGVLDALGVDKFSIIAISGGGPYAQHVAAKSPDRVRSLHLAAAYTGIPDAGSLKTVCELSGETRATIAKGYSDDPASWWTFPADSVVNQIPGFVDAAVEDGKRALRNPAAMTHEFDLFCQPIDVDLKAVNAPAFLYYSPNDTTTPLSFADWYAPRLPNVVADRRDLAGNHDEQYRHWDQILVDLATPDDPTDVVCDENPSPGAIRGICFDE